MSVIIAAYNEESRIGTVLDAVTCSALISQIIVVNDGSKDKTADEATRPGVNVLTLEKNRGKGAALIEGINQTKDSDILLFLDADLVGFKSEHISILVEPLIKDKEVVMTVGKFTGGRKSTDLAQFLVPNISGQRAIRGDVIAKMPDLSADGYGAEVAITRYIKNNGLKFVEVPLKNVSQVMKEEKLGLVKGLASRIRMYYQMTRTFIRSHFRL
ncbi:MAG: glycosyltransferase family 2 protein [Actinobacteria bacterium]|nr:MAG: glycosyltransferase family 2 protein [Actinomycetota bacterium]